KHCSHSRLPSHLPLTNPTLSNLESDSEIHLRFHQALYLHRTLHLHHRTLHLHHRTLHLHRTHLSMKTTFSCFSARNSYKIAARVTMEGTVQSPQMVRLVLYFAVPFLLPSRSMRNTSKHRLPLFVTMREQDLSQNNNEF